MSPMTKRRRGRTIGRKTVLTLVCLLSMAAGVPGSASAQEVEIETDARLEGYQEPVVLEEGSLALTWLAFAFVSAIALLGLFKDAKRSHLD
jgi:hypothetical protein